MSDMLFVGTANKISKVVTITVGGTLSGETFQILVGGVVMASHTDTDTTISTTVAALVAAWNANVAPWSSAVAAGDSSPDIILTAKTKGIDFAVTLNAPGGAATLTQATTQANKGPNDISDGDNWLDVAAGTVGAVPAGGDDAYIDENHVNICWGLAITCDNLFITQSNFGLIGLNYNHFATSADGVSVNQAEIEYRETYLACTVSGRIVVGERAETLSGSGRIKLNTGNTAVQIHVLNTAPISVDPGRLPVRLLANNANTDVFIRKGGVGIAKDKEGEVATVGDVVCGGRGMSGRGTTLSSWVQEAGVGDVNAAADIPAVKNNGGQLTTDGIFGITTLTNEGGTTWCNNRKTSGDSVTTMHANAGVVDGTQNYEARTWGVVNHRIANAQVLTNETIAITTYTQVGRKTKSGTSREA